MIEQSCLDLTMLNVCQGSHCPVCIEKVVPGLDAVFCKQCREYFPTPTGIRMEKEREEKKRKASSANAGKGKKGKADIVLNSPLFELSDLGGYSHHDFEDNY